MRGPTTWEPPPRATAQRIRSVAERMRDDFDPLIDRACDAILEATPALADDPVLAATTRASTSANISRWITATIARPGERVRADLAPEALDLARDLVRRGMDRDGLLTAYRQGQNVTWQAWMRCAREDDLDGEALVTVLDFGSRSLFSWVDGILDGLARQMDAEREELVGGTLDLRRETVSLILDGAPVSEARASARLGYELERTHTALVLWADTSDVAVGELEHAAGILARVLGIGRPFIVPTGTATLWAWTSGRAPDPGRIAAAGAELPLGIAVAIGSPLPGIGGFRDSHREARDAQRLAMRKAQVPRITTYGEVRVVSLALQDEARAGAFVQATLGDLLAADDDLRETLRVYLREDSSAPRAAAVLHTHRNTILKRVGRAERALPRPLPGHALEVRLALELERWIAPAPAADGLAAAR